MKTMTKRALVVVAMLTTSAHVVGYGLKGRNAHSQTNAYAAPSPQGNKVEEGAHGKYAEVNGLKMYYEVRGSGQPLVQRSQRLIK
jgi:hypothetical protein